MIAVGPVCAGELRDLGLDPLVPDRSRLGPMIRVLTERLASQAQRGQAPMAAGLSIRGSVIESDGTRIELSDKEAALVAALSRRSGTVVSRAALLEAVWDRNTSAHTVDVTVALLRRRLGNLAGLVETVPRRGYRWNNQRV